MKLSPGWSWAFTLSLLATVGFLVRFAVLAFLPLRPDEIEPPEWVNPGMEPAKFEADVRAEEQSDGTYRISVLDADGVVVVVSGLDDESAQAFLQAFAAGIDYAVGVVVRTEMYDYEQELS